MLKKTLYILLSLPLILLAATSCQDDFPSDGFVVGEGEATVSAQVNFHPLTTNANSVSRAPGNAISVVNDMTVFVYNDKEDELIRIIPDSELRSDCGLEIDDDGNTDMPNDAGGKPAQAEETTARAKFTLKNFPFGKYRIYCVANTHNMDVKFLNDEDTRAKYADAETLKNTIVEWNESDISKNDAMFGYFTYDLNDERTSQSFNAPVLIIGQKHMNLHAWIRRCASKVTIVYDGSGLHQGIKIYIKSVTIKDIPKYCKIGANNGVYTAKGEKDSLIATGGTLFYDSIGVVDASPGTDYNDWLEIAKGTPIKGAVEVIDGDTVAHTQNAEALYFFENMQGDYGSSKKYDKRPDWNTVGFIPEPGQPDYKDNVKYGSYIEVEAYYNSENHNNISQGKILYRYMLGQNDSTNYNAARNRHYQLTLGFRGYANQPDWHIVYKEPTDTFYTDPSYYISYAYNHRAEFPIRIVGDVTNLEVEIVENNWAPFDSLGKNHAPAQNIPSAVTDEKPFQWNRDVYDGEAPVNTPQGSQYYYRLQNPTKADGSADRVWSEAEKKAGAPEKVTPIWAGFLALMVPDDLSANIIHTIPGSSKPYSYSTDYELLKDYYYGDYDRDKVTQKIAQNIRTFSKEDLTFDGWDEKHPSVIHKEVGSGNNVCKMVRNADGSTTINLPMWTRPKTMLGISGFTGNNPYDTYQRRAMVRIYVKFKDGREIVKFKPVYQVSRVVNPKGVWRRWNDPTDFDVKIVHREGAGDASFKTFDSDGAWRAYVKSGDKSFIELQGGVARDAETGGIVGNTLTPVEFKIHFVGNIDKNTSKCAIVEVQYHGFTCTHSIFVRQGYDAPLAITGTAKWSSYSLFSSDGEFGKKWNNDAKDYVNGVLTANPLSLGTLFKRGNYNGILIENNINDPKSQFGVMGAPGWDGKFKMSNSKSKADEYQSWHEIPGYAYNKGYNGNGGLWGGIYTTFAWARFKIKKGDKERIYRVPSQADYTELLKGDFGIGVLYGDGATETALNVNDAYGFEDFDNDGNDNTTGGTTRGMRGIIVFNPDNANQVFFPIGARGMGRRTIMGYSKTSYDYFGTLRYGAVTHCLTQNVNVSSSGISPNQFRPIPYNMPAAPGAIYWSADMVGGYDGWDMNYFDLNFNAYDYAISYSYTQNGSDDVGHNAGDALPMKLVYYDEDNPDN